MVHYGNNQFSPGNIFKAKYILGKNVRKRHNKFQRVWSDSQSFKSHNISRGRFSCQDDDVPSSYSSSSQVQDALSRWRSFRN